MSTVIEQKTASSIGLAPLRNGDRLDQRTFHQRYAAMPEDFRAELIGGIVFVPSPVSKLHANYHADLMGILFNYRVATPGVNVLDNGTVILDDENEPQPDAVVRIADEYGGESFTTESGYVAGAPELHIEVAYGSESIDLNRKLQEYERAGVCEYLVLIVRDKTVRSFVLTDDAYAEQSLPTDRIWRSRLFPGLWLDVAALFENRGPDLLQTLQRGLDSQEHRAFVQDLTPSPTLDEFANRIGFPAGGTRPPGGNLRSSLKHHFGNLKLEEIGRMTDIDHPPIVEERKSQNEPYRLTLAGQDVARQIKRNLEQA